MKNHHMRNALSAVALGAVLAACSSFEAEQVNGVQSVEPVPAALAAGEAVMAAHSSVFSDEEIAALEARMADYVADGHVRGIATRLVHQGQIVSDMHTGIIKLETQTPIADDTLYRIYSMTKPITGVAMMMLWEEGKFSLDDPITKFVPEFENLRVLDGENPDGSPKLVDAKRPPTIREIMSHTAGFAYGLSGDDPANTAFRDQEILRAPDLETFIAKTAEVPLLFQPGEQWVYSASVDIQGYVVQQISGMSFGEFLDRRIFTPLGMDDTAFVVGEEDYARFSEVYAPHPETGELVPVPYDWVQFTPETASFESGGGGLVSSMDDYTRFCQMLANGGALDHARLIKPETLELMRTDVLGDAIELTYGDGSDASGHGFGLDFGLILDGAAAEGNYPDGTYYWGGAAGTWFWIDPVNDLFFIGMVQEFESRGADDLRAVSAEHVYAALADAAGE
ncbi:MAG: serine hydrolase domain-containing protein [Pseudomonadota bacterium]